MPHTDDRNLPIDEIPDEALRRKKLQRWSQLETERSSWWPHWKDVAEHLLPRSGRFFTTDRNRGGKDHYNKILDSTPTRALRVLGAGMLSGASSPSQQWFKLKTEDPDLNKFHPVKLWLEDAVVRMMAVFARSNTYRQLHKMYEEMAAFGTTVSIVGSTEENLIHHFPSPVGEYALAQDYNGKVDTLYRKFERTAAEVVREFGLDNVSDSTKRAYEQNELEAPVEILHAIERRRIRDITRLDNVNMPWESCYLETGGESGGDFVGHRAILRKGGFLRLPVLAPRWAVNGADVYGHSPGMESLGDMRQLNQEQLRKGEAIDFMTDPPKQLPTSMRGRDRETFPGGISFYDQNTPHGGIRSAYEIQLDLNALLLDIQDVRERINGSFLADLFLLISNAPAGRPDVTATEIAARQEEKLLQLGPTLLRLHNEGLEPLVDMTFERMLAMGMFPPPPPDLEGVDLGIEFISILAQAQRLIGMNAIDRWTASVLAVAGSKPDVLDKFNADAWAEVSAERLGVDPNILVSDEKVRALREARNRAIAAKEQQEAMAMQAQTVNQLAGSPTDSASALTEVVGALG